MLCPEFLYARVLTGDVGVTLYNPYQGLVYG